MKMALTLGRRLSALGVAGVAAASMIVVGSPAAHANGGWAVPGVTRAASYDNCMDIQRTYNTSWTKITKSCYYTGFEGRRHWHSFEYRSLG